MTVQNDSIENVIPATSLKFRDCLVSVRDKFGKPFVSQVFEILRLRYGPGQLGLKEYYYYGLFDDQRFSTEEKRRFLGWRMQRKIGRERFPREWFAVCADKLTSQSIVSQIGVRLPKVYALYHPYRAYAAVPTLYRRDALADFLRKDMTYPFFGKPSWSDLSYGVASVDSYDEATDSLILFGGRKVPVERFVESVGSAFTSTGYNAFYGYMFQERLAPHSDLKRMTNGQLGTIRLVVFLTESGPEIVFAVWKIPCGSNVADNLARWGNMVSAIDLASGRIERLVRFPGPEMRELKHHPDTGETLLGHKLPLWRETKEMCLTAAKAFPAIPIQGWDIAVTDSGPVALEINLLGDFNVPQFAHGQGLWQGRFKEFVESLPLAGKG